jgi:host factor-I protein
MSFDNFSLILRGEADQLIYKHAISSITSSDGSFRLHGGKD